MHFKQLLLFQQWLKVSPQLIYNKQAVLAASVKDYVIIHALENVLVDALVVVQDVLGAVLVVVQDVLEVVLVVVQDVLGVVLVAAQVVVAEAVLDVAVDAQGDALVAALEEIHVCLIVQQIALLIVILSLLYINKKWRD